MKIVRGGDFLMRVAARVGVLNVVVHHQIGTVTLGVPLSHVPWDRRDIENYEFKAIDCLCKAIANYEGATLFDCGADIGAFTSIMCSKCSRLASVIAFEPNSDVTEILTWNMSQLPIRSRVIAKAVSCFDGRGKLESPACDPADVARFLVPGEGPVEVTTVDAAGVRGGDIAIKIDVEGGELEVLKGATETIAAARACAVVLEAHPLWWRERVATRLSAYGRSNQSGHFPLSLRKPESRCAPQDRFCGMGRLKCGTWSENHLER